MAKTQNEEPEFPFLLPENLLNSSDCIGPSSPHIFLPSNSLRSSSALKGWEAIQNISLHKNLWFSNVLLHKVKKMGNWRWELLIRNFLTATKMQGGKTLYKPLHLSRADHQTVEERVRHTIRHSKINKKQGQITECYVKTKWSQLASLKLIDY